MAEKSELKLERIQKVGQGGFGVVYRGKYGGQQVAIKDIDGKLSKEGLAEANLLKTLHHPHIIHYIDVVTAETTTSLIMEYADGGSLFDYIEKARKTRAYWKTSWEIMLDVAYGMTYLHEKRVVHADLKSLNILLRRNKDAVICDFGLAKTMIHSTAQTTNAVRGSVRWFAPELCLDRPERTSFPSDVWAFGCVLLEIITKKVPWIDQYQHEPILAGALSKPENTTIFQRICMILPAPEKLRTILCHCCAWSKADRPNFLTIVDDLKSISEEDLENIKKEEENSEQSVSANVRASSGVPKRSTKTTSSSSKRNNVSVDVQRMPETFTTMTLNDTSESEHDDFETKRISDTKSKQNRKDQSHREHASSRVTSSKNTQRRSAKTTSSHGRKRRNSTDNTKTKDFLESWGECFPEARSDRLEIALGLRSKPPPHRKYLSLINHDTEFNFPGLWSASADS